MGSEQNTVSIRVSSAGQLALAGSAFTVANKADTSRSFVLIEVRD
jgi:hypothetical protein